MLASVGSLGRRPPPLPVATASRPRRRPALTLSSRAAVAAGPCSVPVPLLVVFASAAARLRRCWLAKEYVQGSSGSGHGNHGRAREQWQTTPIEEKNRGIGRGAHHGEDGALGEVGESLMATDLTKAADVPRLKKTIKAILHLRFGPFVGVALLHLRFGPSIGVEHFLELQNTLFGGS